MGYTFEERLNALRSRKEEQTKEKIRRNGYMDEDDYGCVPPPEDFVFHPECNDKENGTLRRGAVGQELPPVDGGAPCVCRRQ